MMASVNDEFIGGPRIFSCRLCRSGNASGLLSNTTIVIFKTLLQDLEIEPMAKYLL
jgi:hypothetical protein